MEKVSKSSDHSSEMYVFPSTNNTIVSNDLVTKLFGRDVPLRVLCSCSVMVNSVVRILIFKNLYEVSSEASSTPHQHKFLCIPNIYTNEGFYCSFRHLKNKCTFATYGIRPFLWETLLAEYYFVPRYAFQFNQNYAYKMHSFVLTGRVSRDVIIQRAMFPMNFCQMACIVCITFSK